MKFNWEENRANERLWGNDASGSATGESANAERTGAGGRNR
ncbi:hypothetical protein [Komarekiella delphini-convector]|nr:hypothetical protein [Komarekiella delphini-convector]